MKDFQGGLLAKSRLQINRVENFYYIKNYDGKYLSSVVNKYGSELIFKSKEVTDPTKSLFYISKVDKRIYHYQTYYVLEAELYDFEDKIILSNYNKDELLVQKWKIMYVNDDRYRIHEADSFLKVLESENKPSISSRFDEKNNYQLFTLEKPVFDV